jgi:hypothetical protein
MIVGVGRDVGRDGTTTLTADMDLRRTVDRTSLTTNMDVRRDGATLIWIYAATAAERPLTRTWTCVVGWAKHVLPSTSKCVLKRLYKYYRENKFITSHREIQL